MCLAEVSGELGLAPRSCSPGPELDQDRELIPCIRVDGGQLNVPLDPEAVSIVSCMMEEETRQVKNEHQKMVCYTKNYNFCRPLQDDNGATVRISEGDEGNEEMVVKICLDSTDDDSGRLGIRPKMCKKNMLSPSMSIEEGTEILPCLSGEDGNFALEDVAAPLQMSQCLLEEEADEQRVDFVNPISSEGRRRFLCLESTDTELLLSQRACSIQSGNEADLEDGEEVLPCASVGASRTFFVPSEGRSFWLRQCMPRAQGQDEDEDGQPRTSAANGADDGARPIGDAAIDTTQLVEKVCLDSSAEGSSLSIKVTSCFTDENVLLPMGTEVSFLPCFGEEQVRNGDGCFCSSLGILHCIFMDVIFFLQDNSDFSLRGLGEGLQLTTCPAEVADNKPGRILLEEPISIAGNRRFLCLVPSQEEPGSLAFEQRECSLSSNIMADMDEDRQSFELLQCTAAGAGTALSVPTEGLNLLLRRCIPDPGDDEDSGMETR